MTILFYRMTLLDSVQRPIDWSRDELLKSFYMFLNSAQCLHVFILADRPSPSVLFDLSSICTNLWACQARWACICVLTLHGKRRISCANCIPLSHRFFFFFWNWFRLVQFAETGHLADTAITLHLSHAPRWLIVRKFIYAPFLDRVFAYDWYTIIGSGNWGTFTFGKSPTFRSRRISLCSAD